jgi:hypothetical protein
MATQLLPEVVTPGDTLNYMERVDTEMTSLDRDILAADLANQDLGFFAAWKEFFASWKQFFADHSPYWARLGANTYNQTEQYEKQLSFWYEEFRKRSGRSTTAPAPVVQTVDPSEALAALGKTATAGVMTFAAVLGVGILGWWALETRAWRKL